jgi:hypothetical protein
MNEENKLKIEKVKKIWSNFDAYELSIITRAFLYYSEEMKEKLSQHRQSEKQKDSLKEYIKTLDRIMAQADWYYDNFYAPKNVIPHKRIKSNFDLLNCQLTYCKCINCFNHDTSKQGYPNAECNKRGECGCINCKNYRENSVRFKAGGGQGIKSISISMKPNK